MLEIILGSIPPKRLILFVNPPFDVVPDRLFVNPRRMFLLGLRP